METPRKDLIAMCELALWHTSKAARYANTITDLQPGNYTAIVRGVSNTTGVALVEAYDLD